MSVPAQGGLGGVQERQTIRGFGVGGTAIDGFRIKVITAGTDTEIIDRVEVVKGPDSLITPGGQAGGSSIIYSKSPQFKSAGLLKVEVADEYFGNKATIDTTGTVPGTERFAYRLIATHRDAHSYIPGRVIQKTINPMLTWAISDKAQLKLKGFISEYGMTGALLRGTHNLAVRDDFPFGTGAVVSKDDIKPGYTIFGANGAPDWTHVTDNIHRFTAEFTTTLTRQLNFRVGVLRDYRKNSGRSLDLDAGRIAAASGVLRNIDPNTGRSTPNYDWALKDPTQPWNKQSNPYEPTYIAPGSDLKTPVMLKEGQGRSWDEDTHYQADLYGKFDFGGSSQEPLFTLHTVLGTYYIREVSKNYWGKYVAEEDITAIYDSSQPFIAEVIRPRATGPETLRWRGGGEVDKIRQYYANAQIDTFKGRLILSAGVSRKDSLKQNPETSPSYGVVYKITQNASVYVSHSENAVPVNYWNGQRVVRGIFSKGKQDEVGVKLDFFNKRLSVSSAYFEIEKDNQPVDDPRDVMESRRGDNRIHPQLLLPITNEGLEFDVAGEITSNLRVLGSFTKQKMRNQVGFKQANVPDELINAFVRYGFNSGVLDGLAVHFGLNHSGKSVGHNPPVTVLPTGERYQYDFFMPSRTIFNGGASYRWKNVNFQLNIDNLFDSDKPMIGDSRTGIALVPPRNVRLTTTYRF